MIEKIAEKIRIKQEKKLGDFLNKNMNLNFVNFLLNRRRKIKGELIPFDIEGYCTPLTEKTCHKIYENTYTFMKALGFNKDEILFYISDEFEINAKSFLGDTEANIPHIIILNSGLLERGSLKEVLWVIAHELSHIYYGHGYISNAFNFVYPPNSKKKCIPPILFYYYSCWKKLNEISSDRLSLCLTKDFESAIKMLFKGPSTKKYVDVSTEEILNITKSIFEKLKDREKNNFFNYPAKPIRITMLDKFYNSDAWELVKKDREDPQSLKYIEKSVEKIDEEIVKILGSFKEPVNEKELVKMLFISSAASLIMKADKHIEKDGFNYIINILSEFYFDPTILLNEMLENPDKAKKYLKESSRKIKEKYPDLKTDVITILTNLMVRDKKISDEEVNILFDIASKFLEADFYTIIETILGSIQKLYKPLY